jgi:hypothetical protein
VRRCVPSRLPAWSSISDICPARTLLCHQNCRYPVVKQPAQPTCCDCGAKAQLLVHEQVPAPEGCKMGTGVPVALTFVNGAAKAAVSKIRHVAAISNNVAQGR